MKVNNPDPIACAHEEIFLLIRWNWWRCFFNESGCFFKIQFAALAKLGCGSVGVAALSPVPTVFNVDIRDTKNGSKRHCWVLLDVT